VCSLNGGRIFSFSIARGSHNDQGHYNMAVKNEIEELNVKGVADRGIRHQGYLVNPTNTPKDWEKKSQQGK